MQVTAALFLIILLASPVLNQAWIALGLEAQLDQSSAGAKAASKTYSQLLDMRQKAEFFIHAKKMRPSALRVMEELARILPSDTYLRSLRLTGDELQIVGDSKDASRLIEIVEHSPQFNGAHFASALVGGKEGGTERFAMTAKIVPEGDGE